MCNNNNNDNNNNNNNNNISAVALTQSLVLMRIVCVVRLRKCISNKYGHPIALRRTKTFN